MAFPSCRQFGGSLRIRLCAGQLPARFLFHFPLQISFRVAIRMGLRVLQTTSENLGLRKGTSRHPRTAVTYRPPTIHVGLQTHLPQSKLHCRCREHNQSSRAKRLAPKTSPSHGLASFPGLALFMIGHMRIRHG